MTRARDLANIPGSGLSASSVTYQPTGGNSRQLSQILIRFYNDNAGGYIVL